MISTFDACCELWGYKLKVSKKCPTCKRCGHRIDEEYDEDDDEDGDGDSDDEDEDDCQDDPNEFIGAVVKRVKWMPDRVDDDTKTVVVRVETSLGNLDLTVFNTHNGYYPHEVVASWKDYYDDSQCV